MSYSMDVMQAKFKTRVPPTGSMHSHGSIPLSTCRYFRITASESLPRNRTVLHFLWEVWIICCLWSCILKKVTFYRHILLPVINFWMLIQMIVGIVLFYAAHKLSRWVPCPSKSFRIACGWTQITNVMYLLVHYSNHISISEMSCFTMHQESALES